MKSLLLVLLIPYFAFAQSASKETCRFSKKAVEHNMITVRGCNERICNHVVICGKVAKTVNCKMPNGTCDGYTADECVAKANAAEAEFDTAPRSAAPKDGAAKR